MRLLVSVRSAAEAVLAASNGVDIVDAKEPDAGPLGAVSTSVLHDIHLALPSDVPLGVALGDANTPDQIARVLDRIAPPARVSGTFLKVGFAGACRVEQVAAVLRRVVEHARELGPGVAVIAASYSDYEQARTLSPEQVLETAIDAGAMGALIDTWSKDGRGLLRHMSVDALAEWVTGARRAGLLTAVAGSLTADDLEVLREVAPDVIGFRGAACRGGRAGTLDIQCLQHLRATLDRVAAAAVQPSSAGELPERAAPLAPVPR
jgi:(5-formylfuran-3-yl)methyl phosphate synthase